MLKIVGSTWGNDAFCSGRVSLAKTASKCQVSPIVTTTGNGGSEGALLQADAVTSDKVLEATACVGCNVQHGHSS